MLIYNFVLITLFSLGGSFSQWLPDVGDLPDWDYMMFSQRWPISSCIKWEQKNQSNVCNLPKNSDNWVVHGLWPTKTGTDGPNGCNSAIHFDPEQLQPFIDDLNNYWTNIEGNTKPMSFWSHEWDKHGTCASSLPQLDSVYNYFKKGIELNREYNITEILAEYNIVPNNNNYTIDEIVNAFKKKLNKTPQIQCIGDSKTKESLIIEIRLCFDKSFQLIDCTSVGLVVSDCSEKKPVKYLKEIPGEMATATIDGYYIDPKEIMAREAMLQEWFILIKFLIWFTL